MKIPLYFVQTTVEVVLRISAENEIWCASIDDVFQSAVLYCNTGLPCEFRLCNSHVCLLDSRSHTIRTENHTGKCLSATGSSGWYVAVAALCGPSLPGGTKRELMDEAFVRLRPNRPVMNGYAQTHHILTTHTAELPTAILTPTAAMTIA
ncbi:uncharacterized protein BO95DRAFT_468204 [Aspergillus brunneoviolaceus CBS 621.78]|uniref:Uncharacterized protein n=1 Tax=Aspergillus brunneoviolaceus CBS 621.78 TaxID=1450534 RepID=A0ACD1FVM1_9EURO|nr:hypothetical protein BO95DRAFT_468204 [Aspergillus brunneoviolaceus CBS 621.78]RAH41019.1 hypothetical protein BO95DRAFT_468204 [Aspergillus brunneoviolaceus CBS 621.78]